MKTLRKTILGGMLAFGWMLAWGSNAISPTPAMAAAKKIQVDDDKAQCPKATFTDIQLAINSLGPNPTGTITVCAGTYTYPITINNAHKLKLIAKKGAVITVPVFAPPFAGTLLSVTNSTSVTVQGFTLDGQGWVGATGIATALAFEGSSGTIQKNTITNWNRLSTGSSTSNAIMSIHLTSGHGEKVKIIRNIITNFERTGILAEGPSSLTITGNIMDATPSISGNAFAGIQFQALASGRPSGVINGNRLTGRTDVPGGLDGFAAIDTYGASHFRISGNILTRWRNGLHITNSCIDPSYGVMDADRITISGNKMFETGTGIFLMTSAESCDIHNDHLRITGNKFVNTGARGDTAIFMYVNAYAPYFHAYVLNALVKGNTINNFHVGVNHTPASDFITITGKFAPNNNINVQ